MIVKTTEVCERLGGCKIVKTKTPFFSWKKPDNLSHRSVVC